MRLYHGTDVDSAAALLSGDVIGAAMAEAKHIDGEPGFYLATVLGDAEFFAARRWVGRVVVYELSDQAIGSLDNAGAVLRSIPGGRPPYFAGNEYFVPVAAFDLFNDLMARGEIHAEP